MKTFISLFIIVLCFTVSTFSQEVEKKYNDIYTRTMLHEVYEVIPNTPTKNGYYKEYDKAGTLIEEANYKNNKLHGQKKTYYIQLLSGSMDNPEMWYGKLMELSNYENGQLNGQYKHFSYITGKQIATSVKYFDNGAVTKIESFYDDGSPKMIEQVNGECKGWYKNGQLAHSYTMIDGVAEGSYDGWYENGQPQYKGNAHNSINVGEWLYYHQNGDLHKKIVYDDNGDVQTIDEYAINGNLKCDIGDRIDDKHYVMSEYDTISSVIVSKSCVMLDQKSHETIQNGDYQTYHTDGSIKTKQQYVRNSLEGLCKEFSSDGELILEGQHKYGKKNGDWVHYSDGNIVLVEKFSAGNMVSSKTKEQIIKENEKANRLRRENEAKEKIPAVVSKHSELRQKIYDGYGRKEKTQLSKLAGLDDGSSEKVYTSNKKRHIFESYLIADDHYMNLVNSMNTYSERLEGLEKLITLNNGILKLLNEETDDLEKSLKKTDDPEDIYKMVANQ